MPRRRRSPKAVELIEKALRELQAARNTKANAFTSELKSRPAVQISGAESPETNPALDTAK